MRQAWVGELVNPTYDKPGGRGEGQCQISKLNIASIDIGRRPAVDSVSVWRVEGSRRRLTF